MAYTEDVNIQLNVLAGAMGGLTAISTGMSALTSTFGQFGTEAVNNFGAVDGLLVTTTALIGTFAAQSAEAFGEFEQGMKIVQTVSGQAQYSIQQLGEQANQLSIRYRTAIGDITDGLQTLGRAGLNSAETQMQVLESGLQTAKLEGRNLNGVLEELIQNTAMLGGNLKSADFGSQADYLNSLLVGTSMTAPINSHDISQTLQYAGGTAAVAGANLNDAESRKRLEDLMGTVAAFAQKGVTGSMAGTALRAFFTKPASQDKSVTDALSSINLSPEDLWTDGGNSMRSVSDQISIIQRHMDALNLSTMEQVELWGKIVGPKMGQQMMKLESSSIKTLTSDIQKAQSAQELANKTLHTYNQKLSEMSQLGDLAFRGIGEKAIVFLNPVVDIINKILELLSNPVINTFAFVGIMGLMTHGIKTAWGMVKVLYSEIKALLTDVSSAVQNLAGPVDNFNGALSTSSSRTEVLNAKLEETNRKLQIIQGNALGIVKADWVAAGGKAGEKVGEGVVESAEQNMFLGGSYNGIKWGEPGRLYSTSEKSALLQEAKDKSKANAEVIQYYENRGVEIEEELDELDERRNDVMSKQAELDDFIYRSNEVTGDQYPKARVANSAIRSLNSMKKDLEWDLDFYPDPNADVRYDMANAGVTDEAVYRAAELKKELEEVDNVIQNNTRSYQEFKAEYAQRVIDSKAGTDQAIKSESRYIEKARTKALDDLDIDIDNKKKRGRAFSLTGKKGSQLPYTDEELKLSREFEEVDRLAKERRIAIQKELGELGAAESFVTRLQTDSPEAKFYEAKVRKLAEVERLLEEAGMNQTQAKAYSDQLKQELLDIDEEMAELMEEKFLMPDMDELKRQFPTFSEKDFNKIVKDYNRDMHAEIVAMTDREFDKAMIYLEEEAKTSAAAKYAYDVNKEADRLGTNRSEHGRTFYRLSDISRDSGFDATMEGKMINQSKGKADKLLEARKELSDKALGLTPSLGKKIENQGQSIINGWKQRVTDAGNALESLKTRANIFVNGLESMSGITRKSAYDMAYSGMTFEGALTALSTETGLSTQQLAKLIISEGEADGALLNLITNMMKEEEAMNLEYGARVRLTQILEEEVLEGSVDILSGGQEKGGRGRSLISGLVGAMGGIPTVAMMGGMLAMQVIQDSQQKWQKSMQEAEQKISEALEKQSTAEERIKEAYSQSSGDSSEIGAQNALVDAYADIYDASRDQSLSLDENTAELMRNTESLKNQMDATNDITMDRVWGVGQWGSEISDRMGTFVTLTTDLASDFGDLFAMNYNTSDRSWFNIHENPNGADWGVASLGYERTSGLGYFDNNNIVLTASQSDDNYPWLKEFAPILSADIWDLGIEGGLKQAFGGDFNKIEDILQSTTGKTGMDAWNDTAFGRQAQNIKRNFGTPEQQNRLQMSLKNFQGDFQQLGYQTRFFEKNSGGLSAYGTFMTGKGRSALQDEKGFKALTKASKQDTTRLINYIKSLAIKTGMTEQQVLLAAQLQQMQDMQQIANDVVSPNLMSQTEQAISMAQHTAGINSHMPGSESGAITAGENARAIAALLQVEMEGKLQEGFQRSATEDANLFNDEERKRIAGLSPSELYAEGIEAYNRDPDSAMGKAFAQYYLKPYATTNSLLYGANAEYAEDFGESFVNSLGDNTKALAAIDTLRKGSGGAIAQSILDAYDLQAEQAGQDSSNVGSGGSGGDDKDKDKDKNKTGTRKERVDLVLCNKKEIPKLNVNLFKKPPNFTVLNKNFKLRDIKINSQDKPKAIMNAIKNGIIETQKRMDPKIIQDEAGEYNPLEATEGSPTPSGTTETTT